MVGCMCVCRSTRTVWWIYRDGGVYVCVGVQGLWSLCGVDVKGWWGVCVCVGVQGLCGGYIGMVGCMCVSEYKDCGVCVVWM